jgi:hypothetical protein
LKNLNVWLKDIKEIVLKRKHDISAEDLIQEKRKIIEWTKNTYTIANRFGDMNYQEMLRTLQGGQVRHLSVTEHDLNRLQEEEQ